MNEEEKQEETKDPDKGPMALLGLCVHMRSRREQAGRKRVRKRQKTRVKATGGGVGTVLQDSWS